MYTIYLRDVLMYVFFALGIPGNILSAIIWLRRHVISKNSSSLYLTVLAINDLVYLILYTLYSEMHITWLHTGIGVIIWTGFTLESLLVLGFSVERLIAISCPLQVGYVL